MVGAAWLATVRSVIASAERSDVQEIDLRGDGLRIRIRRGQPSETGIGAGDRASPQPSVEPQVDSPYHLLRCPLTGIWYDSPSPGTSPFVRPDDPVDVGTVVGLVETMKVFNEVVSDVAGVVMEIVAQRGQIVSAHAPVMAINVLEELPRPEIGDMA